MYEYNNFRLVSAALGCVIFWLIRRELILSVRSIWWIQVPGKITEIAWKEHPGIYNHHQFHHQRHHVTYQEIKFEYAVHGKPFEGSRVSFDDNHSHNPYRLSAGQPVRVYHSKHNPAECVIFRSPPSATCIVLALLALAVVA